MNISTKNIFTSSLFTALFWGISGGIALIIVTKITTNGHLQILPYPFVLITAIISISTAYKKIKFNTLFFTGFFTCFIMSLCLNAYVRLVVEPNSAFTLWMHLYIILIVAAIAGVSSFIAAFIANGLLKKWLQPAKK